ncbi:iron chaperone [Listeria costaricensis]|uniref:iron chaperone n=1 Tax=Listeria costaricensis TaxID=2026604 RepID=UPI000C0853E5|nr:DUF1801 domain-containing protein [Listeria costaricensis]
MADSVIESYIEKCDLNVQPLLRKVYETIQEAVPAETTEKISYGMPTFYLHGNLVHFAPMKKHLGFYPTPSAVTHFASRLTAYKTTKGAIQFPYDQPIPYELIAEITKFRVEENVLKGK